MLTAVVIGPQLTWMADILAEEIRREHRSPACPTSGDTALRPPLTFAGGDPLRLLPFYARQVTSRCQAHYGFVNELEGLEA